MLEQKPFVSIIMNCHNGERFLREAINSVFSQTFTDWEIVFFDNASTDSSKEIALSYGEKLRYFKLDSLIPLYAARNLAIDQCRGEAIAFLDCDDIWLPNKLETEVFFFKKGNKIVYSTYQLINEYRQNIGLPSRGIDGRVTRHLLRRNFVSIGCVMMCAQLLQKYKFDPTYDLLGDFDLWVRLSVEHPFFCSKELGELSRQHNHNTSKKLKSKWILEQRRFYRKYFPIFSAKYYPDIFLYMTKVELKSYFK